MALWGWHLIEGRWFGEWRPRPRWVLERWEKEFTPVDLDTAPIDWGAFGWDR